MTCNLHSLFCTLISTEIFVILIKIEALSWTPGVNFINYWRMEWNMMCKSWSLFLAVFSGKVVHGSVGETEWCKIMTWLN